MRRFNPSTYDPGTDSSPGSDDLRFAPEGEPGQLGIILIIEDEGCQCGCGAKVRSKKADFIPGHDAKLKGKLIRAALANLEISLNTNGILETIDPFTLAERRGWGKFIEASEAAADRRKISKVAGEVQGPVDGDPWVGAIVQFKDRGREREGVVLTHNAAEATVEIDWRDAKGKPHISTGVPTASVTTEAMVDADDEPDAEPDVEPQGEAVDLDDEEAARKVEAAFEVAQ